jgi:hypothetical protein
LIAELSQRVKNEKVQKIILYAIISEIALFAMASTRSFLLINEVTFSR